MEKSPYHYPVMYREVLEHLNLNNVRVVVDCTLGLGSLASKLLEKMPADSILIGLDRDERSLNIASQRLSSFGSRVIYFKSDFLNLDDVLGDLKIQKVDAFIFDLGISTYQLS
ncbi:MAG: 16S rRNA (cytosine(1402)-N(4))-methyltransferase, partial [Candidatus Omnitrophica bacterium]|nr:16S rRNA (cytosine(1402)-N(4))-methyltransferase [Candidatus Omnitrophota bacterium]